MIEIGKTYTTKFAVPERFKVNRIINNKEGIPKTAWGIYEERLHLGECPLEVERLIDPIQKERILVCKTCKKPIDI